MSEDVKQGSRRDEHSFDGRQEQHQEARLNGYHESQGWVEEKTMLQ